jgi:hypothetical protein
VLDNSRAAANERQFEALDKALTLDLSELVDRSFYIENRYINLNAVRMTGEFLGMLVYGNMEMIPKSLLGSSMAYQASKYIVKYISPVNPNNLWYLRLYLSNSVLLAALEENSRFSKTVFESYIEICESIIEQEALVKWDLSAIGDLGRMLVANATKFSDVMRLMRGLLEVNRTARSAIRSELRQSPDRHRESELKGMKIRAKDDAISWLSMYHRKAVKNEELESLLQHYLEDKDLNPD